MRQFKKLWRLLGMLKNKELVGGQFNEKGAHASEQNNPKSAIFIASYSKRLAYSVFRKMKRDTGESVIRGHLLPVVETTSSIINDGRFQHLAIAAAWLHDIVEDIDNYNVVNPFASQHYTETNPSTILINNLLSSYGELGNSLSYIVFLLTHNSGELYQDYIQRIFNFPDRDNLNILRLHVIASIIKLADKRSNLNLSEEGLALKTLSKAYDTYTGEELLSVIRKMKLNWYGRGLPTKTEFLDLVSAKFRTRQKIIALENLSHYLPLAERRLLIRKPVNRVYDKRLLRELLTTLYMDSIDASLMPIEQVIALRGLKSKSWPPTYKPIIREIAEKMKRGELHTRRLL
ncbi:MAG: hypothetical protein D6769_00045 [Methanobacteriota archaeon]|nr:MAG: hypothetical protein D6769_00045 [Euryarchaeota archaeon]